MKALRIGLVTAFVAALALVAPSAAQAATNVTVAGQTHALTGTNITRTTDALVQYTPAWGASTRTNQFGYEAAVVGGKVTNAVDGVGNMAIPSNGYVLSGHGTSRTFLKTYAKVGATVSLSTSTTKTPKLPDLGVRTLRLFQIVHPTSGQFAGKKLLKFPGVTANVGNGPLEIHGHRTSSTSTDWVAHQTVYNTDGTKTQLPSTGATFFFAGDGHNHWHIKDFDKYEILNASGTSLKIGEKHGFCFEDNTDYRDWPSTGKNGTPANPVYVPSNVCGVDQPNATDIMHGLSVGWSDTYPATLPDQAIDITGLANGRYIVRVTADWQNFWKETNETNNSASATIDISGDTVTLVSAPDGL